LSISLLALERFSADVALIDTTAPRTSSYLLSARPRPRLAPVTVTTFPEKGSGLTAYEREAVMSPIVGLGEVTWKVLSFGGKVQPKHF
jgi:hypothetical protein